MPKPASCENFSASTEVGLASKLISQSFFNSHNSFICCKIPEIKPIGIKEGVPPPKKIEEIFLVLLIF
jgi:hypothetical protein